MQTIKRGSLFLVDYLANKTINKRDGGADAVADTDEGPVIEEWICEDYLGDHEISGWQIPQIDNRQAKRAYSISELPNWAIQRREKDPSENSLPKWSFFLIIYLRTIIADTSCVLMIFAGCIVCTGKNGLRITCSCYCARMGKSNYFSQLICIVCIFLVIE